MQQAAMQESLKALRLETTMQENLRSLPAWGQATPSLRANATTGTPPFVQYFHPRVERTAQMQMYIRAQSDSRPASVAYCDLTRSQLGSIALADTVKRSTVASTTGLGSATSAFYLSDKTAAKAGRLLAVGEKRNVLRVSRLDEDDYRFEQSGRTLEPGHGAVLDRDTVADVVDKLQGFYPSDVPSVISMGDAVEHGTAPTRQVRTVLESRGKVLLEEQRIGEQCLRSTFSGYFHPRAERATRVNLAARARADGRMDAVAFLQPSEYMQRSTSRGAL